MSESSSCKSVLIKKALTTFEIDKALRDNNSTSTLYSGTFSSDLIPRFSPIRPSLFIVNLAGSSHSGTHWTLVFFPDRCCHNRGSSYFFDSFGREAEGRIDEILSQSDTLRRYLYNSFALQDPQSNGCGHFVLAIAWLLSRGVQPNQLSLFFSRTNLAHNDCLLKKIMQQEFPTVRT